MRMRDIINTVSLLTEAVRPNRLYHATTVHNLYEILEEDEIKANTGHPITHTGGPERSKHWSFSPSDVSTNGYLKGVSLTRNAVFARAWRADGVILVLDGDLIRRDFKMIPVSFWQGRREVADEAEEFVIGSIKPISRYLIHVETNQRTVDSHHNLLSNIDTLFPMAPKLVVNGHSWKATGLDKGAIVKS